MSTKTTITVTYFGKVAVIHFIRPRQMNSFTPMQYLEVMATFKDLAANDAVHCVILTGTGPMYSSGHDLSVSFFSGAPGDADVAPAAPGAPPKVGLPVQMIHAFIDFPKPLITAVNGGCVGIGATMTQLGEFTLVADDAWFDTPFLPLGLVAEGCASLTFPRALGVGRANEMLFAGRKLSAAEAAASGFALKAVPRAALLPEALALAQEVAAMPLDSLVSTKKTMRDLTRAQLHALADKEGTEFARRLGEADFARALAAFKARKSKGKASVPAPETLVAKL